MCKLIKLKGGEVRREKCRGQWVRWRLDKFNFMAKRNLKIHHIWGRDHDRPAFRTFLSSDSKKKKKKKRNRHDPTRLGKACSYRRNKHIYGNTFHTFGCGVKGLGSVGELTDWISALAAGACFLTSNLEAL